MPSEINEEHMLGIIEDIKELESMLWLRNLSLIPTRKGKIRVFLCSLFTSHTCQMFN